MVSKAQDSLPTLDERLTDNEDASAPYIGKWNRLVSRTNWEKGRIICEWRDALVDADRPAYEFSDEAWATRVGGISSQHVGRLRRVWQRFGQSFEEYDGLYWSHFLVAMDWEDAEMWLEGAAQNGWSVSQMRGQRWEAVGAPDDLKPNAEDVFTSEWDEDSPLRPMGDALRVVDAADSPDEEDVDAEDRESSPSAHGSRERASSSADEEHDGPGRNGSSEVSQPVRPFANLPELPDDVAEAFEQFKIAILAHRMTGWQETSREDVVASLRALEALALAPLESDSD